MHRDASRYKTFSRRSVILFGGKLVLFSGLIARMYHLQIIEGHKYISKNTMHDFMIKNNIEYKMYYLKVPMEIMDERSKKRDNGFDRNIRTTNMIEKQLIEYDKVISKYKSNVEIRSSESWESCENIANEIFESLELII